jgi:hypothetical protein
MRLSEITERTLLYPWDDTPYADEEAMEDAEPHAMQEKSGSWSDCPPVYPSPHLFCG